MNAYNLKELLACWGMPDDRTDRLKNHFLPAEHPKAKRLTSRGVLLGQLQCVFTQSVNPPF